MSLRPEVEMTLELCLYPVTLRRRSDEVYIIPGPDRQQETKRSKQTLKDYPLGSFTVPGLSFHSDPFDWLSLFRTESMDSLLVHGSKFK